MGEAAQVQNTDEHTNYYEGGGCLLLYLHIDKASIGCQTYV